MTDTWYIRRFQDGPEEFDENLFDAETIDAVNRFGRKATAYIDDVDGQRKDKYPRGTGVEFYVEPDGEEMFRRFAGMVIEPREAERNGADIVEVEVYSFDYFLRQNTIERDFEGEDFFSALEEIITDFTPVKWVAENVQIVNNDALTRTYLGEKVDEFLNEISSKSANEEYGVNDDLEFFFRPREIERAPRDIDNTQWINYDFPEEGKPAKNEIQVFYGEGGDTGSVIVDNGEDKQELQSNLGLDGPGILREEVTYEDIDNDRDARDKGQELLNERETVERGEVTTYGLYNAIPGDVINVEIGPLDIDQDFRIAEIEYQWADDETVLQLAEKRDKDDERLVRMTDTLDRVERRNADRDAIATRYIDLGLQGVVDFSIRAIEQQFNDGYIQVGYATVDNMESGFGKGIGYEFPDDTETSGGILGNGLEQRSVILDE